MEKMTSEMQLVPIRMLIHLMPPNKAHGVKAEVPLTTRGVRRMREREARRAEKKKHRRAR